MENLMTEEYFLNRIKGTGKPFSLSESQIQEAQLDMLSQFEEMEKRDIVARTYSLEAQKGIFITF